MNPGATNLKNVLDICRCCLKPGMSQDVYKEIASCDDDYVALLQETFSIQISQQESPGKQVICDSCTSKLLAARDFKEMVLQSNQIFAVMVNNLCSTGNKSANMCLRSIGTESLIAQDEFEERCDGDSSLEDEPLSVVKKEIDEEIESSFGDKTSTTDNRNPFVMSKTRRGKNKKDNAAESKSEKDWAKITERRGNGPLLRENSLKLVEHSTACVFQWYKSKYTCFCCKRPFSDIELLRTHTSNEHTLKNIEKKIIMQQNQMVKVEISILICKICSKSLQDLQKLREHLTADHNFDFKLKEDLLVPFKIQGDTLQCQLCSENFTVFRLLNIHMNKHYQKQVCHVCGAAFSNLKFLNLHKTRVHRKLSCKRCGIEFATKIDKRNHDVGVHELKCAPKLRFPCPHCDARFLRENLKVLHLVEKHGLRKPEFNCGFCPKTFVTKSLCNNHVKSVHLKERKHACSVCNRRFYSACDVARHRATHAKDKKFCCALCNGPFATKDSLRRHMKRTHSTALNAT